MPRTSTGLPNPPWKGDGAVSTGREKAKLNGSPRPVADSTFPMLPPPPSHLQGRSRLPILQRLAQWWTREDALKPVDALIVLAGDSAAGDRLQRAVELYRQGWAPLLILSGPPFRPYLNESQLMEQEARQAGVPHEALLQVPHTGASTLEEASYLLLAAAEAGARNLIIVSSNFHVRRVRAIYRALARKGGFSIRVGAANDQRFNPAGWWKHRVGIVTVGLELLKSLLTAVELCQLAWRRSRSAETSARATRSRQVENRLQIYRPHR